MPLRRMLWHFGSRRPQRVRAVAAEAAGVPCWQRGVGMCLAGARAFAWRWVCGSSWLNGIGAGSTGDHPLELSHGVCDGFNALDGWRSCGMRATIRASGGVRSLSVWRALERGFGLQAGSSLRGRVRPSLR